MTEATNPYIGRFAPSPTGALHTGSLLAALASFLDAKANQGLWLVRMEDIDPPREVSGAADQILRQLDAHGLHWDGPVLYQSTRLTDYRDALQTLKRANLLFKCYCSRAALKKHGKHCTRTCQTSANNKDPAIRIHPSQHALSTPTDLIQENITFEPSREGDFILQRRDQLPAYQLATSLDDSYQNISRVIRGSDLLDSTPRQMYVLHCLKQKIPEYGHIPILTNSHGQKLSKQNLAPQLKLEHAADNVRHCLYYLGTPCPPELAKAPIPSLLSWAITHWQLKNVPTQATLPEV